MSSNLKIINPSKENELFSVHNYRKLNLSQYSSNGHFKTNYNSFITQKNSLLSLKKLNKYGLLTETNKKNRTNHSIKDTQIPYPSFPKKNRIPAIFRNSYNKVKYPKISNSNFTLYNYNKNQSQNQSNKNVFYSTYSSIGVNTDNNLYKEPKKNIINKTLYLNMEETKSNGVFTAQNELRNKNSIKNRIFNIEFKKNYIKKGNREPKINNFSSILDNMMHSIEVKDQNNNSLLYTKVTNLLLNELNKLFELKRNKYKREREHKILTYRKINISNRKMRLSGDSSLSFVESTHRRIKSSKLHQLIKINIYKKYGFHLHNFKKMKFRRRSELAPPLIPNNKKQRNGLDQINDIIFKNKYFHDDYFKGKSRYDHLNKNEMELKTITNHDHNNDYNNEGKNSNKNNLNQNSNNTNSLFTDFYKDGKRSHGRKHNISVENNNHGKTVNPNLLHNFINSIAKEDRDIPIFEQMVQNDRLIKLIHEYLEEEEKEDKTEKDKKEEKKIHEKWKINEKLKLKLKKGEKKDENEKNLEKYNDGKKEFIGDEIDDKNEENKIKGNYIYKSLDNDINEIQNKNEEVKYKGDIVTENKIKNIKQNNKTKNENEKLGEINKYGNKKIKNEENTIMNDEIFNNEENHNDVIKNNSNYSKENISDNFDENENMVKSRDENKKKRKRVKFTNEDKDVNDNSDESMMEEDINRKKINILKKLEFEVEIVKHVSGEIKIKKDEQDNIEHILDNLVEISKKENISKREDSYKNRVLMPMDDITKEYLNNMRKINASQKKPKNLFDKSLRFWLKKKIKELIEIGGEEYNYNEEKDKEKKSKENTNKKNNIININIIEAKKSPKKKENDILKQLIFDHSYFFRNKKKKNKNQGIKENNINLNSSFQKDDDNEEEEPFIRRGSFMNTANFDFNDFRSKSKSKYSRKSSRFYLKTKKSHGLKLLIDETDKNYMKKKMMKTIDDEAKIKNDEVMDKKLKAFFEHIRQLKNISDSNDEEKLRIYLDKEIERFDYTQEKRAEERRYNFFNDLKMARMASKNEKNFFSKKLLFHPPLIFNMHKNNLDQ